MDVIAILAAFGGFIFAWLKVAKKLANRMWIIRHFAGAASGVFAFFFIGLISTAVGVFDQSQEAKTEKTVNQSESAQNVETKTELPQKTDQNILITASDIIRVSDFEFKLANKSAVSIAFGESESKWCDVTIHRESVYEGLTVISNRRQNHKEISFECYLDSVMFILNDNIDTNVKLELTSLDNDKKIAEIVISAKLHELTKASENRFGSIARLMGVNLTITGDDFDNLIKQM